ncbi:MAG: hypothetical protein AAGL69_07200 [Pseudomonadota bacterium]
MRGENFLTRQDDCLVRLGFFTTIRVEAPGPDEAELRAIEILKARDDLKQITRNPRDDSPMLYLEEISELDESAELENRKGYTWFPSSMGK